MTEPKKLAPGAWVAGFDADGERLTPWAVLHPDWTVDWEYASLEAPAHFLGVRADSRTPYRVRITIPTFLHARRRTQRRAA